MRNLFRLFLVCILLTVSLPLLAEEDMVNEDDSMTSSYRQNYDPTQGSARQEKIERAEVSQQLTDPASFDKPAETFPVASISSVTAPLYEEIKRYQKASEQPFDAIPLMRLKYHSRNQYVVMLRNRLELTGDLNAEEDNHSSNFDKNVLTAVKQFQSRHGLKDDGIVGVATLAELNITPIDRVKQLQANFQRLQQLFTQLGDRYILVNIPDFKFHLVENGHEVLTMNAIVGKPDWPTPELTSRVTRIVFNPFWNVPDNIATNDVIPKIMSDPYYLNDMHIRIYIPHGKNDLEEVSNRDVNWEKVAYREKPPYLFRQDPGDGNALGLVKFEFANEHSVYMHDTPAKNLFSQEVRALSHGCIRLENPFALVEYLIKDTPQWDNGKIQNVLDSRKTTYVRIGKAIPIYITYLTAWVDDKGLVNYRGDIYNKDLLDQSNTPSPALSNE